LLDVFEPWQHVTYNLSSDTYKVEAVRENLIALS
jgi:hypothetical protein